MMLLLLLLLLLRLLPRLWILLLPKTVLVNRKVVGVALVCMSVHGLRCIGKIASRACSASQGQRSFLMGVQR